MSDPVLELTSDPENINNKQCKFEDQIYTIKNYDRNMVSDAFNELFAYKSVIYDETGKLLCVAPPKSIGYNQFISSYECDSNIEISEIIEGTMINLFYHNDKWVISTRGAIGGSYFYFRNQYFVDIHSSARQISFYDMFMEALQGHDNQVLNDNILINNMDKTYCYSFVMQHPDNHIVIPVSWPQLYLVGVYKGDNINNNKFTSINRECYECFDCFKNSVIRFPKLFKTNDSFQSNLDSYSGLQEPYTNVGIMMYNKQSGVRCAVKTHSYLKLKELRGNNPNLQFQYLSLRRMDKVTEFLSYFPRYKKLFYKFYVQYKDFMFNVHRSYIARYITKKEKFISNKYMPHIFRIHQEMFVPHMLKGEKTTIKLDDIYNYFKERSIAEVLYALNYDARELHDKQINIKHI